MKKIRAKETIAYLEENLSIKPKAAQIVEILGLSSEQIYYNKLHRNGFFSSDEIKKIEKYYKIDLSKLSSDFRPNAVEIEFLNLEKLNKIINPKNIKTVWMDKTIIRDVWCRNEQNLRIISMPVNSMAGGFAPINPNDNLVIDIKDTEINFSGVFAYTTRNNSAFFVNVLELKADGSVKFSYFNPAFKEEIYSEDKLKEIDFKLVGRVIKNLSIGL